MLELVFLNSSSTKVDGLTDLLNSLITSDWTKKRPSLSHGEKAARWFHLHCHCGS